MLEFIEDSAMLNKNYYFVHIPKTAGSTLKAAVATYAKEDLIWDYNHPFDRGPLLRNIRNAMNSYSTKALQGKLIFGHLFPCKYCDLSLNGFNKRANSVYLTFLREPLQRAISHYYYWKRHPDIHNRACVRLLEEDWSLEKFLTAPFYKNFYAQYFFGFDINKFDFIGITERHHESFWLLKSLYPELSTLDASQEVNCNSEKIVGQNYIVEPSLESIFKKNNVLDYQIYDKAKSIFNRRLLYNNAPISGWPSGMAG